MRLSVSLLAAVVLAGCASVAERGRSLDAGRLHRIETVVQADAAKGRIPGAVALVARDGKVLMHRAIGPQDAAKGLSMRTDSIFRICSMTKPMVSVAAMMDCAGPTSA